MEAVVTDLKKNGLLRTYYRDRLRGFRLGPRAKATLLDNWPERFTFYLTGDTDTNRLKSEVNRRLRLHRLAEAYTTMGNAGVAIYPDEKSPVFAPQGYCGKASSNPAFYSSREVKGLGIDATKIHNSRFAGVLLSPMKLFVTYSSGMSLMKWRYKSEMRVKAVMWNTLCQQRLPGQYRADDIHGLILGDSMELAYLLALFQDELPSYAPWSDERHKKSDSRIECSISQTFKDTFDTRQKSKKKKTTKRKRKNEN